MAKAANTTDGTGKLYHFSSRSLQLGTTVSSSVRKRQREIESPQYPRTFFPFLLLSTIAYLTRIHIHNIQIKKKILLFSIYARSVREYNIEPGQLCLADQFSSSTIYRYDIPVTRRIAAKLRFPGGSAPVPIPP